ncbi:unnamed protein product [Albugo candida]|uniref:Uncharacterized protein n=1 Tax=Albugo candida TaxID=65357 RepID=A0A024G9X5_9STRA|nr:unnamed protein product [Albugo candida]|eukprot:CCI43137.1 unnamed protein product [Albugo candida]
MEKMKRSHGKLHFAFFGARLKFECKSNIDDTGILTRSCQRKCAGAQNAKRCCHFFFMKDQCDVPRFPADICCCVRWNCGSFAPFASGINCAQGDHRTPADSH